MTKNVEKFNEPKELFSNDEAGRIAQRIEEMIKKDPSLNDPKRFEEIKEKAREELRKEAESNNKE